MKDRIRMIMETERLSPSEFADKLQIGRAVVSHILNGRNNPSLDVVTRILSHIQTINPDWLLSGKGSMYKQSDETRNNNSWSNSSEQDLFSSIATATTTTDSYPLNRSQNTTNVSENVFAPENGKENIDNSPSKTIESAVVQPIIEQKMASKKVTKIIIYYDDNTFETFNADNRPL